MPIANPRRFALFLTLLTVLIIAVIVLVVFKPFAHQHTDLSGLKSGTPAGSALRSVPAPSSAPRPMPPPAAVEAILTATNKARLVVVSSTDSMRAFIDYTSSFLIVAGKLDTLQLGRTSYTTNGNCYNKTSALIAFPSEVQRDFFTPVISTTYQLSKRGRSTVVDWKMPHSNEKQAIALSGTFIANQHNRITRAIFDNTGKISHYTISYPSRLQLPARPTKLCSLKPSGSTSGPTTTP